MGTKSKLTAQAPARPGNAEDCQKTAQALHESEQRYKQLLASVTDYIYTVVLHEGQPIATVHGAGCTAVTGYTPEEYQADPYLWYRMIHEQDRAAASERIAQVLAGHTVPPLEHRIIHKDGSIRWVRNTSVPRYDEQGRLVAYDGLVSDITQRKQAEEALARERDLLHALMDNVPDTIYFKDTASRFTRINAAQAQVLGVADPELAVGKSDFDFFTPEHAQEAYADEQDIIRTGQPLVGKIEKIRRADGEFRWVSCTKSPIKDQAGRVVGIVGMSRDITEQMQAEEMLRQYAAELRARNEELDAFAHTVAHDLKHSLSIITGLSEALESEAERAAMPAEELSEYLRTIARRGRKLSSTVEDLLLLSSLRHVEDVDTRPLDMAGIVTEALDHLIDLINDRHAKVIVPAATAWPTAVGYAPWVEQVWVNYISNAIKYGGQPPRVELGIDPIPPGEGLVRFWVRDNGPGLTPQEQAQLFEPFKRLTQAHVKGYGLGLSIVRRIMEKLGGQVGVESQPGQGSVFSFTLPRK